MAGLAISLFGTFHATLDNIPLTSFESDKVRALLAYLAVETREAHSRAILADLLWPEQNEERARRSLSQALYNLRTVLGERNSIIVERTSAPTSRLSISPDGIQLNLGGDDCVDVVDFSRLMAACDQHLHRFIESCTSCLERFQAAAELYRGDFLDGFSVRGSTVFENWALLKRESYRQDASRAFSSLAAYQERQGRTQDALQAARRLAELEPYDDGACQGLMRLLADCGQRGDALAVYERFRQRLRDDLEVEPEAQTRAFYDHIRLQKDGEPVPSARYTNLPASLSPLIGREAELAEVQQRLLDPACRLLTIVGPGGSGKSRLALEAARGLLDRFADGVFLVSLSPLISLESFIPGIAAALGLQIQEKKSPMLQVQDYLRRKELLLVLDGCEGFLEGVPQFLELLRLAPDLKLLATSRARLNVEEEQVYQLGGLQCVSAADPQAAAQCAAVRLFASGARRRPPGI